jgi:uncharacterized protein
MKRTLIIFAKEPVPGKVKTRLAADLGEGSAADLYAAMLEDVLDQVVSLEDIKPLVFWSLESDSVPLLDRYPGLETFVQQGPDLGERMEAAFTEAFSMGAESCCIIGSDLPDLPLEHIRQAFDTLEQHQADIVFGPAEDGGYYLVGMQRIVPGIFDGIQWSTGEVLASNCLRAADLGLKVGLIPLWYDIDLLADIRRLASTPGSSAPRTRQAFAKLDLDRGMLQAGAQ